VIFVKHLFIKIWRLTFIGLLVLFMGIQPSAYGAQYLPEYRLKAAVLLNIIKFVDWPEAAFSSNDIPFTVGILGVDPFGPFMEEIFNGRKIKERKVHIVRAKDLTDLMRCHVLFISDSKKQMLSNILDAVRGQPTLIVSDMERFVHLGGMLSIFREDNKIHFDANRTAYRASGFTINAQLLKLARERAEE
jgi:hypothetical protein